MIHLESVPNGAKRLIDQILDRLTRFMSFLFCRSLLCLCDLVVVHSFLFWCLCLCISEIAICISFMPASFFIFAVILNADDFKMKVIATAVLPCCLSSNVFHYSINYNFVSFSDFG